jgi:protease-4
MAADRIVARPGTLTGSIGVTGGKPVSTQLERKLGLHTGAVAAGAHARFHSGSVAFSDSERDRLNLQLDRIYEDFTSRVAHDRELDPAHVHTIAKGRVWTGAQAHERGLVDGLGGYQESLKATRDLLGLPADAPLRVHRYPPPRSPLARLRGASPADPAEQDVLAAIMAVPTDLDGWLQMARTAARPRGALLMPWVPRMR